MSEAILSQIEKNILQLPLDEQLLLISRVEKKLKGRIKGENNFESELAEMANDENIQRELKEIEKDFHYTEFDGLAE